MPVSERYEDNWRLELSKHKKGKIGLWYSFVQMLGVGGDMSVNYENGDASVHQFKRLSTRTFWPTKEYVLESVMAQEVQKFLASKRFRHNVYMVTGISVAVGATVATSALRKRGIHFRLGVDGTTLGAPASVGPQADIESFDTSAVSFDGGSDFVFAFRLREICYSTRKGVSVREFTKGALYGLEPDNGIDAQPDTKGEKRNVEYNGKERDKLGFEGFELLGLAGKDVSGEDVNGDVEEVEDIEGEDCEVVKPMI